MFPQGPAQEKLGNSTFVSLKEIINRCEHISSNFAKQIRNLLTSKDIHARKKRRLR